MSDYATFLRDKSQANTGSGFAPVWLPDFLKPSYFRQAVKNVQMAAAGKRDVEENGDLFDEPDMESAAA